MNKTNIKKYLLELSCDINNNEDKIYFYPNRGNSGDSLIAYATYRLFQECNLNYCSIKNINQFDPSGKIVVYGGGGNLIGSYKDKHNNGVMVIDKFLQSAKKIIILPHTIYQNEKFLSRLNNSGKDIDLFCREEISYQYVKQYAPQVRVMESDDLAFTINKQKLLKVKVISLLLKNSLLKILSKINHNKYSLISPTMIASNHLKQFNMHLTSQGSVLNCFRADAEKTDIAIPNNNIDLSMKFGNEVYNQTLLNYNMANMINFIQQYNLVKTNRLHLCIAAAILDKEVQFYPNNYFKNEAVFNFSIKGKYPKVQWMG